ncbi:hypothetical protein V6N11_072883 [Hibiscus sabdariffa]|uniref:Senescence domain-containing protein n=1 Tax=Hibiscus sabdariffa TaxID=183260 RepID=A0ABR2P0C2_9ROSI
MSDAKNPNEIRSATSTGTPRGRPPDLVPSVPATASLERLAFPTPLVAIGDGKVLSDTVNEYVPIEGEKVSYASKVLGDKVRDRTTCPSFFGEEEECQTVPIKMHSGEERDNCGVQSDKLTDSEDTLSDLFGPWMLVLEVEGDRSDDLFSAVRVGTSHPETTRPTTTVAPKKKVVVAVPEVTKNAAYLASNPPKKSARKVSSTVGAVVVTSVTGQNAVVVEHGTKVANGMYKAIKIVEDRYGKASSSTGSASKTRVGIGKVTKENVQRGIKARKLAGSKLGDRKVLAE